MTELEKWKNDFKEFISELSMPRDDYKGIMEYINEVPNETNEDLPSITPKEKTGHWRHYEGMLTCSECGTEFYDDIMEYCGDDVPKCCPNCGIRMEVVKE